MILRENLESYLDTLLDSARFNDYAPNGLQIQGKNEIYRICTAVTASEEAIEYAIEVKAEALIVHHGYFWKGEDSVIKGIKFNRISKLLRHGINLFAYHLPLDCHPELGNNACLGALFNLRNIQMHDVNGTPNLLWSGQFEQPKSSKTFIAQIENKLARKPLHLLAGTNEIKTIQTLAWCTGAAQDFIEVAHQLGVDAYLSGEVSERTYYQAKELGIHYFAAGHHATERYGVQALGAHLAAKFNIEYEFVDSENPV